MNGTTGALELFEAMIILSLDIHLSFFIHVTNALIPYEGLAYQTVPGINEMSIKTGIFYPCQVTCKHLCEINAKFFSVSFFTCSLISATR